MAFVTGLVLEGERECGIDEPSWADVENLIENMLRFDLTKAHGVLTLEGPPNVQLSLALGNDGRVMVSWHDWDSGEGWVIESEGATGTIRVGDAEYPARQFVDPAAATAAARTFFETGARHAALFWSEER